MDVADDSEQVVLAPRGLDARIAAEVGIGEERNEGSAVLVLLAEIVQQRRQHDLGNGHAQRLDSITAVPVLCGAAVHRQRQLPRQLHHPQVRTVVAPEERRRVLRTVDDHPLLARVAGEYVLGQRVDVDVRLRERRLVAAPPLLTQLTHR
ncbi:hypothetical protein D3C83_13290 [compost metagenome]